MEKEELLKKIVLFLKILIVIAVINTILLLVAIGEDGSKKKVSAENNTNTQENTEYDVSGLDAIDANTFLKLFSDKKSGTNVIYLGREGCSYCTAFLPHLKQAQSDLKFTAKYLDISTVSEEDANKITALNDFLSTNYGYTPIVIVTKDGKFVDGSVGYLEYDELVDFLNKSGVK